jgi:ferredoxin/NAD(P)H-dependent FMN reductase
MKKIKENKLKITIIVFSPSGNTLTTAKLFEQSFSKRKAQVQLINFTARKEIADQKSIAKYLNDTVTPHDVLCIGGPVYAGHLQENVKNIIKALPLPDEKWGSMVVPFISYGGVHSSVALKEAGILLRKRNRKNISGVKIAASHSLTKKFEFSINESKPGQEEIQVIEALADRVVETVGKEFEEIKDVSNSFSYISFGENLLYNIFSEKMFHKIMFGEREFNYNKCTGCGLCAKRCPMQIIEMRDKKPEINKNSSGKCCYCAECYNKCKYDAISWDLSKSKKYLSHMNSKGKFESQQSAVYPL